MSVTRSLKIKGKSVLQVFVIFLKIDVNGWLRIAVWLRNVLRVYFYTITWYICVVFCFTGNFPKEFPHTFIAPPKLLESSENIKGSDILWSILALKKILEKVLKVTANKKSNVPLKVLDNVACKHLDTKIYTEENLEEKT